VGIFTHSFFTLKDKSMECFKDLIGIRELCNGVAPKSSIYLDDVGVSLSDVESFITSQYSTAMDYFEARQTQAVREMSQHINNHFQDKYLATSLIDSHRLGIYNGSQTLYGGQNYRGIQMKFNQADAFYGVSIGEISLLVDYTGTIQIEVWDLLQNKQLDTIDVDVVSGEIATVYLHKSYKSDKRPLNLFVGYDSNGIDAYVTPIKANLCCGKVSCGNSYVTAQGVEINGAKYESNIDYLNHTAGISLVYDVKCDHSSWICSHAESLSLPLAYKTAELLVADALYNTSGDRATNHHTINKEQLQERFTFYMNKYNEFMSGWLGNMKLPNNKCFICNSVTRHKITLP